LAAQRWRFHPKEESTAHGGILMIAAAAAWFGHDAVIAARAHATAAV